MIKFWGNCCLLTDIITGANWMQHTVLSGLRGLVGLTSVDSGDN